MTFTNLVDEALSRLNLSSTTAQTRIENAINRKYKEVTSTIGLNVSRRTQVQSDATVGSQEIIFTAIEKVLNVIDKSSGRDRIIKEVTVDEIRAKAPNTADRVNSYAILKMDAHEVTILVDCIPQTAFTLYADGYERAATLSGSQEPAFPESFHQVLVEGVLADELRKMEKPQLAQIAREEFQRILSDLRMFIAKSTYSDIYSGKTKPKTYWNGQQFGDGGGTGGGGATAIPNGAASYTQTGLISFDRTGQPVSSRAPFAVATGSEVVANLIAESATTATTATTATNATQLNSQAASYYTNANNLASGTVPDARFPATLPAASGANLTALNASNLASGTVPTARLGSTFDIGLCEGRLTLETGVPVSTTDQTAKTSVYFTPYKGNRIALYDGSVWDIYEFTEKTLALGTLTSGLPYDVFIYNNSGTLTLEALAWTSSTARATALTTQNGVLVKSGATTRRYLGTFYTTSTTTTEDSVTKRYLWNYYNRVRRPMRRVESTASWNYTTLTWRQANAAAANQVEFVVGVSEDEVQALLLGMGSNSSAGNQFAVAIGLDATNAIATDQHHQAGVSAAAGSLTNMAAEYRGFPGVGRHYLAWLEQSVAAGTTTFYGNNATGVGEKAGIFGSLMA